MNGFWIEAPPSSHRSQSRSGKGEVGHERRILTTAWGLRWTIVPAVKQPQRMPRVTGYHSFPASPQGRTRNVDMYVEAIEFLPLLPKRAYPNMLPERSSAVEWGPGEKNPPLIAKEILEGPSLRDVFLPLSPSDPLVRSS